MPAQIGAWPAIPLELHPGMGLERTWSEDCDKKRAVWITWGPTDLGRPQVFRQVGSVRDAHQPSLLPAVVQLLPALFEALAFQKWLNLSRFCLGFS